MTLSGDNLMRVKRSNRSALLYALHQNGAMSRKRLAQALSLTPAAITKITADLLHEGLIRESGTIASASAGRREILLEINPERRCALGVLINLRKAILSAVRPDGASVFVEQIALPAHADADETTEMLCKRLLALTEEHRIPAGQILGVGVAVRGILTPDGRSVADSFGALAQKDYPLCDRIEALTGHRAVLENNVRALFAAQRFFDREEPDGPQFFLRCEYGIGAAMTIDGQMLRGATQQCAEIGHIPVIRRGGIVEISQGTLDAFYAKIKQHGKKWLPDVLYFNDNFASQSALLALVESGIDIPGDVRFVTWSNAGEGPFWRKSLTRIEIDPIESGRVFANFVLSHLSGKKRHRVTTISPTYIIGDTFPATLPPTTP